MRERPGVCARVCTPGSAGHRTRAAGGAGDDHRVSDDSCRCPRERRFGSILRHDVLVDAPPRTVAGVLRDSTVAAEALHRVGHRRHRTGPPAGSRRRAARGRPPSAGRADPAAHADHPRRRRRDDVRARARPAARRWRTSSPSHPARSGRGCATSCGGPVRWARSVGSPTGCWCGARCGASFAARAEVIVARSGGARGRARRRRHRADPRRAAARRATHAATGAGRPVGTAGGPRGAGGGRGSRRRPGVSSRSWGRRSSRRAASAPICRSTWACCASTGPARCRGHPSRGRWSTRRCAGSTRRRCRRWTGWTPTAPWSGTSCASSPSDGR